MAPPDADVIVIGAGILGLATARALTSTEPSMRVTVLDKEASPAMHQSGRNSGVLHSGLYYRPGSAKARLCGRGRGEMIEYCDRRGIAWDRCGKVVVATDASQLAALAELERRGRANGLALDRLDAAGIRSHEPHAAGIAGLFVRATGVVDFRAVCEALAEDLRAAGTTLRLGVAADRIDERTGASGSGDVVVHTSDGPMRCRAVVNCAGLHADVLARRSGANPEVRIMPFRGEYATLVAERRYLVRHLIYPVPDARFPFLGVHLNRGVDGVVHAGPNAVLALAREGYRWSNVSVADVVGMARSAGAWRMARRYWRTGASELVRSMRSARFVDAMRTIVPEIADEDVVPARSGVRAQAVAHDGTLPDDFVVATTASCVHVLNAPSPAATASLAIGRTIADQVRRLASPSE